MDFEVQRCSRRCSKTDRELAPDETFYSALMVEGAAVVRYDFCEEAWEGPPAESIGWWKSRMPGPKSNKIHWAPNDVMLEYFEGLEDRPEKSDVRYVLALLLIRRRVVRLEDSDEAANATSEMILYCPRRETTYRVATQTVDPRRAQEIQDELAKLLFAEAA
ncbi:MAG: hypothetical protein DWQ31_09750 [Planctomycetota bacterium]|nr:MAG: hypothetical protein DWQ31_09750 [Planctomycetota bacterium]REJ95143.1 MAG: hypothetical protein DWQ35_06990 [Planctomycetota bacterium]REK30226.1 MAG: hypothetical protein DWQ42_02300 [Planctomycetota bacterium]REK44637.1 MAG: hypothetical protein DWQ46_08965 [Planctomycetota bacterium]